MYMCFLPLNEWSAFLFSFVMDIRLHDQWLNSMTFRDPCGQPDKLQQRLIRHVRPVTYWAAFILAVTNGCVYICAYLWIQYEMYSMNFISVYELYFFFVHFPGTANCKRFVLNVSLICTEKMLCYTWRFIIKVLLKTLSDVFKLFLNWMIVFINNLIKYNNIV